MNASTLRSAWNEALDAARAGDLGPARAALARAPGGALDDYFYARCLLEARAPEAGLEALPRLRRALAAEPGNPLYAHALALALAGSGGAIEAREAVAIWKRRGLPHDLELLGEAAFLFERRLRPFPAELPRPDDGPLPPWPEALPRLAPIEAASPPHESDRPAADARDNLTRSGQNGAPAGHRRARRGVPSRTLDELDQALMGHDLWPVLRRTGELLDAGREDASMHLAAGMAADELGWAERARSHLARACELDPRLLIARTILARVYWRLGFLELAIALWRSLPVEGPYDYGRHYHLALGWDAAGRLAEARTAMGAALRDFYFDTRHYFIERAFARWVRSVDPPSP